MKVRLLSFFLPLVPYGVRMVPTYLICKSTSVPSSPVLHEACLFRE